MVVAGVNLSELCGRLAARHKPRTEADVQSDVRTLLLYGGLNLGEEDVEVLLESQAGEGRRIDVEVGNAVIEVKRDLRTGKVMDNAIEQLADYVKQRSKSLDRRYVGVLTDGAEWHLFHLEPDDTLRQVSSIKVDDSEPQTDRLIVWLEGVLATVDKIAPIPDEIQRRLGAGSPSAELDLASLGAIWRMCKDDPRVKIKRELWARLLTTALGTHFTEIEDQDRLFVEHTYLVVTAEILAHAVVGFDLRDEGLAPATLLSGQAFSDMQIHGVVEADFFDWVLNSGDTGRSFVRTVATRLSRFAWHAVEHDVLKVLYESVITPETRKSLGEYYTPDWLAEEMVKDRVTDPLNQTVLDPACGSGTFVYHAIVHHIEAAEASGVSAAEAAKGVTHAVLGIDVHPVAVTLARVTYLLAIGSARLTDPGRGELSVPVYLGDSLLWQHEDDLLTEGGITIYTTSGTQLFAQELHFPARVLNDAGRFDQLVANLARKAADRAPGTPVPSILADLNRFGVHPDDRQRVTGTFEALCKLHDEGRDSIWGYYVRNVARPYWLTREGNQVDVLIGNPPWLAYRYMTEEMQKRFQVRSKERGLWAGGQVATQQDLSGFFVARCAEQYLASGGRLGFVMPRAVLQTPAYKGFREATWPTNKRGNRTRVAFDRSWDMLGVKCSPDLFPVPCCVVRGSRADQTETAMPSQTIAWTGKLPARNIRSDEALRHLTKADSDVASRGGATSPYAALAANGATINPRVLSFVADAPAGPLGVGAGRRSIRTLPSVHKPWNKVESEKGIVEVGFVHPAITGASILPYRLTDLPRCVVPFTKDRVLEIDDPDIDQWPALAEWWRSVDAIWREYRRPRSPTTLSAQVNFQNKLAKQLPIATHRVVFPKSGSILTAAYVTDSTAIVENTAYWVPVSGRDEGMYLCGIFNSDVFLDRVARLQTQGNFGTRDFNKVVFEVVFPMYDPDEQEHERLRVASEDAAKVAGTTQLGGAGQHWRSDVKRALRNTGKLEALDQAVKAVVRDESQQ